MISIIVIIKILFWVFYWDHHIDHFHSLMLSLRLSGWGGVVVVCFALYFGRGFGFICILSTSIKILLWTNYSKTIFMWFHVSSIFLRVFCKLQMDWVSEIGRVTLSHVVLPIVTLSKYCPPPFLCQLCALWHCQHQCSSYYYWYQYPPASAPYIKKRVLSVEVERFLPLLPASTPEIIFVKL